MKTNSRLVALRLLHEVLDERRPLDHALEHSRDLHHLDARDRGFVRLLVATVLRRLGTLDRAIDGALARGDVPVAARHVLRLGLTQLRYLHTPPHAAISTAVDLAGLVAPRVKGLVNAVLRRHEGLGYDERSGAALPDWLWERWSRAYGPDLAAAIADSLLQEAPLDLTVRDDPAAWAAKLEGQVMPLGTVRRAMEGPVDRLPGFDDGQWWVQDLAASLPAKLIGDVAGRLVVDLCAAPGGKTAQLAAAGAAVTAVDRSPTRMARLDANLRRLGLSATLAVADAGRWSAAQPADAVLLDAPCLATGTIRRHPDIPHLKSPGDLVALVRGQADLLNHAADLVKPGGTLVYSTCSLEPEEGERQVEGFLARQSSFERSPVSPDELPGLRELLNGRGEVRALPCHLADLGGLDGFFIARLRRKPV